MPKSICEQLLGAKPGEIIAQQNFKDIVNNEYPGAINIITDLNNNNQQQDYDDLRFIRRLFLYYELGDDNVFEGMIDDALSVNTDRIATFGFVFGPWVMSNISNLHLDNELKEIIMCAVSRRFMSLIELYYQRGFDIKLLDDETICFHNKAKFGIFNIAIMPWAKKFNIVTGNVKLDDVIFGLHSDGRAIWEKQRSSGIMPDELLSKSYLMDTSFNKKYPNLKKDGNFFAGRFKPNDSPKILNGMSISEAILSPARQWAFIVREIVIELNAINALQMIHEISLNAGGVGGVARISNSGNSVCCVKQMSAPPPILQLIKEESGRTWSDMYQRFNGGIGVRIIGEDNQKLRKSIEIAAHNCGLEFSRLGKVIPVFGTKTENEIILKTPHGEFAY